MTELAIQNRIDTLKGRPKENGRIIRKLERELRNLQKKNTKQKD